MSEIFESREETNLYPGGIVPLDALDPAIDSTWLLRATLVVTVVGASGDLAKKKTYPSLLNLYDDNMLPSQLLVIGYARSKLSDNDLRDRLRPYLLKTSHSEDVVERFLEKCVYIGGKSYGDIDAFHTITKRMEAFQLENASTQVHNRLFYFAIPPNVFAETGLAIKQASMQEPSLGWTRLIVEKPFGRDLASFEDLHATLAAHFTEDHLFRIDHYLGKEMVQNLTVLRFSNVVVEHLMNRDFVKCVILTFKEPFGTEGRGGTFWKKSAYVIASVSSPSLLTVSFLAPRLL